jgi:adenosylcobinamide-GDP ribazoletransferase
MVKALILGLQFLTRLPVNICVDYDRKNLTKSTFYFPFIGMLIGSIAAIVYYVFSFINKDIAAICTVLSLVVTTGGLHMDGLSDTADGFFSSRPKEKILDIMKDSRVGAFGVIAIVMDLLFKYVVIKSMDTNRAMVYLILSSGISRTMVAMFFSFGESPRKGGMGDMLINKDSKKYFIVSAIMFILIGTFMAKYNFLIVLLIVIAFSLLFMRYSYKVIGGVTGDVFGANAELCEILALLGFVVVQKWI